MPCLPSRQRMEARSDIILKNSRPCRDLNPGPPRYQVDMLPFELSWLGFLLKLNFLQCVQLFQGTRQFGPKAFVSLVGSLKLIFLSWTKFSKLRLKDILSLSFPRILFPQHCYKRVQSYRVHCLFSGLYSGQYIT